MTNKRRGKRTRRLRRRVLPILCAATAVLIPLFIWQEFSLQLERFEVRSERIPAAFDGFTMIQISDVHNREFGKDNERLLDAVRQQEPDLIAITGDLINRDGKLSTVSELVTGLVNIAPTYYVTGNHEWGSGVLWELRVLLRECGVTILSNEFLTITRGDAELILAGVEDPNGRAGQKTPEELMAEIRQTKGGSYLILLAHRNHLWEVYSRSGADLVLTGHAHGGIIRLPFTDGLFGHGMELLPSYTAGLYPLESGGIQMVSRGLGGPRLFNRPHLPVIVLCSEA